MAMHGHVHIGISGWRYKGWRGKFYPPRLLQRCELQYAAKRFGSIEINGTHYSLQRPKSFTQWRDETPKGFVFAVKGSRFITHMKKLRGVDEALANFFAQGVLALGEKLGPVLWQLPPSMKFNVGQLSDFFSKLPRTTEEAAALAHDHSPKLKGRSFLQVLKKQPVRHCLEIRHESFACEEFIALVRKYDVGLVVADTVEWPLLFDVTSDFVYCRLHGSEQLYASGYGDTALDTWADRVAQWATGHEAKDESSHSKLHGHHASTKSAQKRKKRDVYVYFDNDAKVHAPFDAQGLMERVDHRLHTKAKAA